MYLFHVSRLEHEFLHGKKLQVAITFTVSCFFVSHAAFAQRIVLITCSGEKNDYILDWGNAKEINANSLNFWDIFLDCLSLLK